jgi:hypothetical protein
VFLKSSASVPNHLNPVRTLPCSSTVRFNIVARIAITRQRLGKHIPAQRISLNNRTFLARQRISKHTSSTIDAVFSVGSVQRKCSAEQCEWSSSVSSREEQSRVSAPQPAGISGTELSRVSASQSAGISGTELSRVSAPQPAGISGTELSRVFGIASCTIMARKDLDWPKTTSCVI